MVQISMSDLLTQETLHNPSAFYARLRGQESFAYITGLLRGQGSWIAINYDDAIAVFKDPRFVNDRRKFSPPTPTEERASIDTLLADVLSGSLNFIDPPDHTRLRGLVSKAFTPRMIEHLRQHVQQITDKLLDAVEKQSTMDLVADFAVPLLGAVFSEMLGIPSADAHQFSIWAQTLMSTLAEPQQGAERDAASKAFFQDIKTLLSSKREHPGSDLTSGLVQAEEQGDSLSENELIGLICLLIVAGYGTTVNFIGSGMLALLEHPEQMQLLQHEPSLLPSAIEELLRYTSPTPINACRWASEDIALPSGKVIRKGEMVFVSLSAVNTDPQQFTDPDVLDILRQEKKHLAFGTGSHVCLGAPLARLVGQIAIGTLLRRFPALRLRSEPEQLTWHRSLFTHGLVSLPVTF